MSRLQRYRSSTGYSAGIGTKNLFSEVQAVRWEGASKRERQLSAAGTRWKPHRVEFAGQMVAAERMFQVCFTIQRRERGVSFQLTILKVLAGHPGGHLSVPELRRAVAILMTSGCDWSDRMKRLVSFVPDLDIFGSKFVSRDDGGWQITEAGRSFLLSLEERPSAEPALERSDETLPELAPVSPLFVEPKRRRRQHRRARRAAVRAGRGGAA